jgi:RHS repeat-associated protein
MLDNGNYQQYLIEEINNYLLEQGIDANHLPRQPNDLYESLADGTNNTIIETYNVFPYFYRSDYINASGQGLNNLYPKEQGDPNSIVGHFDKMIYNMSLEPNNKFQEEELCDCWTSSVSALKYGGIKLDPAISPGYSFDEDFDLLDAFLTCVDKKYDATDTDYDICYEGYTDHAFYLSTAISPRPTEGYLDHAYKYFYSDPDNQGPVTQGCLARLNIFKDPNNKWQLLDENNNILVDACDGIDPNSTTPDEPYFSLYHCIRNKIDDNEAEDLAADKGITGICDKTFDDLKNSNITAQELEECYEDRCNDECDSKFNMFVDRLIKLYNDDEKSVQGQPFYQNGATKDFEDPNDDGDWDIIERFRMEYITSTNYKGHTISIEEIYCMASALVENCKVACDVTIDTLNNSMTVHPDYEKVFTHDYEISLTTGTGFSTVGPPTEFQRSKWDSYVEDQLNELLSNYIVYNPFIPASNEEYEALGSNVTDPSIKYSGGLTRNYHYSNYDCCMDNLNYKITFWKDPYNETSYLGLPYHTGPNADKGLQYYNANLFFSLINELFNEQFDNDDMICIPPVSDVVMCKGGDDTQLSLKALYYRPNCQVCPKEDGKINALSDLQYGYYIFTGNVDMYSRYQSFIQPLTVIQDNISFNRFVVDEEDLGITTIPTVLSVNSSTFDYPLENDCDNNIVISCNNTVYFKWITKEIIVDNSIPEKNVKKTCDQIMAGQLKEKLYNDIAVCASETAQSVVSNYKENCTTPLIDDFSVSYSGPDYYHYTLYYYDRAGNLVRTVPPIGVEVNNLADRNTQMNHTFDSEYQYDTKNSVLSEKVPDRVFPSKYVYNYKDQLVFSYDARQFDKLTDPAEQAHFFSYTKYDDLGRVIETGEAKVDMNDLMSKATTVPFAINEVNRYLEYFAKDETRLTTFLSTLNKKMYIKTVYGELVSTSLELNLNPEFPNQGRNLENRVNYIYRDADGDDLTIDDKVKTFYSYDLHGNVEWIMNEIAPAGDYYYPSSRLVGITHYNYDLISGNVNKISYNPGRHDSYYHRYTYDEDQRLKMVETSRYGEIWDRDTRYEYYKHGPLKRTLVGEDKIQGIDYTYTINGWLKGINHSSLNGTSSLDPSEDGMTGGDTDIAPDGFGMVLNYFNNDYYNSGTINFNNAQTENVNFGTQLYNGNIGAWAMSEYNPNILTSKVDPPTLSTSYKYTYDVLNRIKSSTEFNFSGGVWTTLLSGDYSTNYSYDPNGNITNLIRNTFATGGNAAMDNLSYNYSYNATSPANNNKLLSVDESIPDGFASLGDIRMTNNNTNDYSYDASGNLTEDERSGIASIDWTADGKIERINYNNASKYIEFLYDGLGNRVRKLIYNKDYYYDEPQQMYYDSYQMTYYMREANSNVMAVYGRTTQQPLATRGQFNYCIEYNDGVSHSGQFCVFSDNMISFSYGKLKTFFTINPITNGSGGSYVQGSGDTVIVDLTTRTLYVHIQGIDYEYNITQFYSYDLNNGGLELTEWHLWGNGTEGRIAVRKPEKVIFYEENLAQNPIPTENFTRDIRRKHYEFKDHLGNVRITYSDLKNMVAANDFALDLINTTGYYPFGMQMSARTFTNTDAIFADGGHRYGFNGMEKDDEIKGDGNSLNYGNRLYSPRIAKFFKLDPFTARFPWMSPFQYAHNMPIIAIDLEGLHPDFKIDMNINMNTVMKLADKNASDTEIMKAYNRLHYQGSPKSIEELHSMLDAVGFIPVIGEPADALNALIYTFQGDYLNAGISAAAIIPVIGEAGKIIKHTVRYFRSVNQANKYRKYLIHGQRVADAIWDSGKSGKNLLRDNMKKLGVNLNKKQAHHLIPVELAEKNSTVKEAINQGFDFNGIVNGVPLDVTRHSGSHPQYTALVSDFISDIQKANPKLSSKEVVEKAAARARKYIETTTGKLK